MKSDGPTPPVPPASGPPGHLEQPNKSIQIQNNISQPLHIFISVDPNSNAINGSYNYKWAEIDNKGKVITGSTTTKIQSNYINWSTTIAWDPLGAQVSNEIIIDTGKTIYLKIPDALDPSINKKLKTDKGVYQTQFSIMGIKTINPKSDFISVDENGNPQGRKLSGTNGIICPQNVTRLELGMEAVSDMSAVDGINFNVDYTMENGSVDGGPTNGSLVTMGFKSSDVCSAYSGAKGLFSPGCESPSKICEKSTCDCEPGTQDCAFNDCSKQLFKDPKDNKDIYPKFNTEGKNKDYADLIKILWVSKKNDGGKKGLTKEDPNFMPVKSYVNYPANLIDNSPLKKYCINIQGEDNIINGTGIPLNPVPYCYDYNDLGASPTLKSPYKIRLIFNEFTPNTGETSGKCLNPDSTGGICANLPANKTIYPFSASYINEKDSTDCGDTSASCPGAPNIDSNYQPNPNCSNTLCIGSGTNKHCCCPYVSNCSDNMKCTSRGSILEATDSKNPTNKKLICAGVDYYTGEDFKKDKPSTRTGTKEQQGCYIDCEYCTESGSLCKPGCGKCSEC